MAASDSETQCRLPVCEAKSAACQALARHGVEARMYSFDTWLRESDPRDAHIGTSLADNEVESSRADEAGAWLSAWHDSFIARCLR